MSPLKRLSSLGCCEASGTPVTDCLAPEHAPALDLTGAGAHEKKRGTCRADFPRVSCPRCHGPSVPTPPRCQTTRAPSGFHPLFQLSCFLSRKSESVSLRHAPRSSTADRKQWPDHHLLVFNPFLLKDLGGLGKRDPHDTISPLCPSHRRFHKTDKTTDIDAHRPNFNRPPPHHHHLHHHFTPLCHPTPHHHAVLSVAGSWVGSGVVFPCFFFPFASPAADTHGDDREKDSNNRRLSSRGIQELERELTDPPLSSPWAMADQSGVRNEGVEGRTVETPRYSPGRLMALRKSAINQITPPQKGETWAGAGSPVSRPSVSRSPVTVTGSWPSCHSHPP